MCYQPITVKAADGVHEMKVPCGHCLACLKRYQQEWSDRLSVEVDSWNRVDGQLPVVFFTLTYSEENIPKNYLHLTSTGVHLAKRNLFGDRVPSVHWNTTLKECRLFGDRHVVERQMNIESEFRANLQVYLDTFGEVPAGFEEEFEDTFDLPTYLFDPQVQDIGVSLYSPVSFNTVRYSDVRNWLKKCRTYFDRKVGSVDRGDGVKVNPRFIHTVDGLPLPKSLCPASFKYFICSEYGPRTLRPHYHGVIFGVTLDEFKQLFVPLWKFGHVDCSAFDLTKGGMLYVSKYCAKGSYDNPFSKRDFFFEEREYHSKRYEGSIARFGVNLPLSDPCFRVCSHGIGVAYAFKKSTQQYWGVQISPDYVVRSVRAACAMPSVDFSDMPNSPYMSKRTSVLKVYEEDVSNDIFNSERLTEFIPGLSDSRLIKSYCIRRFNQSGKLLSEDVFDTSIAGDYWQEDLLMSKRFCRAYVYSPTKPVRAPFNPSPSGSVGPVGYSFSTKVSESALPRYYHRWLLPPSSKLYLSAASIRRDNAANEEQSRILRQLRSKDARLAFIKSVERNEEMVRLQTYEKLRKSADRFYSKYDPQDLKDASGYVESR